MTLPMANRDLQRLGIKFGHFESLGGCLGYLRDDKLPSYIGIIINHEIRIPFHQPAKWKVGVFFFVAQFALLPNVLHYEFHSPSFQQT